MEEKETIVAIASAPGIGAIGIIRISGANAFNITEKIILKKDKYIKAEYNKIQVNTIIDDNGEIIDEVTIVKYQAPKSYTGENMVEIFCHGGTLILRKVVAEIIKKGAIAAQKGEFTKRAFLNEKFNLIKAEAINEMILSETEIQHKIAKKSYLGDYEKNIKILKEKITDILIGIEAEIEFSEEDDVKNNIDRIEDVKKILRDLEIEILKNNRVKNVKNGIRVIIAGPANAGKSTLFNYLLGYRRSIINEKPGTTRDLISEKILIDNIEITLIDSAGIRKSDDEIEIEGISRTNEEILKSHIIIWVSSANEKLSEEEISKLNEIRNLPTIILLNKCDMDIDSHKNEFMKKTGKIVHHVSLLKEINTELIYKEIQNKINIEIQYLEIPDIISNNRQEYIVTKIRDEIINTIKKWNEKEIAAYYMNNALDLIEEFIGKRDKEQMINQLFENFCIGK